MHQTVYLYRASIKEERGYVVRQWWDSFYSVAMETLITEGSILGT